MSKEDVLDDLQDIVEETAELVHEATCQLTPKEHVAQLLIVAALAGGIGGVVAYQVAKKRLRTKYDELVQQEIAEAKKFYEIVNKKGDFSTPEKAVDKLIPVEDAAAAILQYQGEIEDEEEVEEKMVNVFTEHVVDDDFDFEEEMKKRSPDHPYVIHREEFMEGYSEFDQTTITYYAGDATLADEEDNEIPFSDPIVGEENLELFGYGSGDERIVYIRNEKLSTDFEVIKSDGKFAHEVLGFEHSDGGSRERQRRNRIPKFRGDDER